MLDSDRPNKGAALCKTAVAESFAIAADLHLATLLMVRYAAV